MSIIATKIAGEVATDGTYRHVSLSAGKALEKGHDFSLQRWPNDLGNGNLMRGIVTSMDCYYFSRYGSAKHPSVLDGTYSVGNAATMPADGEKILMGEWPTGARLRSIEFFATTAEDGTDNDTGNFPEFADETDYWDNIPSDYFAVDVINAFPAFTLWAEDPFDSSFTPILLKAEAWGTSATQGIIRSPAALAYGLNNRRSPLVITARAEGAVPIDSALFLHLNFSQFHK